MSTSRINSTFSSYSLTSHTWKSLHNCSKSGKTNRWRLGKGIKDKPFCKIKTRWADYLHSKRWMIQPSSKPKKPTKTSNYWNRVRELNAFSKLHIIYPNKLWSKDVSTSYWRNSSKSRFYRMITSLRLWCSISFRRKRGNSNWDRGRSRKNQGSWSEKSNQPSKSWWNVDASSLISRGWDWDLSDCSKLRYDIYTLILS